MPQPSTNTDTPKSQPPNFSFSSSSSSTKPRISPTPATRLSHLVSTNRASRKTAHRERAADRRVDAYLDERNDQVSRIEWVREQRRWEKRMRSLGMEELVCDEEDEDTDGDGDREVQLGPGQTVQEAEVPMPTEEEEMDALLDLFVAEERVENGQDWHSEVGTSYRGEDRHLSPNETYNIPSRRTSQVYGSDEEDYDQLFMDVMTSSQAEHDGSKEGQPSEAMDLS
ncbi:MAG: hypothetical protein Q9160_007460 [Pyrenula sp. 1 TL-2023]